MIKAKRWCRIGRSQQNLGSQKIDRGDITENRKLKSKYLRSSRSRRSKQMDSAESGKDQEIKTPSVLKGRVSSRAKTCRTGITSKRLLATQAQLFPVDLRDISSLSWNMDVQYLENWNSGFRSRDRGPAKGILTCHSNQMMKGIPTISTMRYCLPNAPPGPLRLLNPLTVGCKIRKSQR